MMCPPAKEKGFTLLELLIALAIFAVAALGALKHSSQSIQQQQRLIDKTLAVWIAENALAEMRLTTPWPNAGTTSEVVSAHQREWQVTAEVSDTSMPSFRKVLIRVETETSGDEQPLVSLIGYFGEH